MYAMQYPITLPADYDMQIIRERIATRGHLLDHLKGLRFKAYCIQERERFGARLNQYAPFYVWDDTAAMASFLGGSGFRGVCESFGRPSVEHWVVDTTAGREDMREVAWATRHATLLSKEDDTADVLSATRARMQARCLTDSRIQAAVFAFDPCRWELLEFLLWSEEPSQHGQTRYQVLHVSQPQAVG